MRSFHGSFANHGSEAERASSDAAATRDAPLDSPFRGRSPEDPSSGRLSLWSVRTVSLSARGKRNGS